MLTIKRLGLTLAFLGILAGLSSLALAERRLADPAQEARAVALHKTLRCLVCQNQSIHDSNASLARDLRQIVRERIEAGDSDEQVIQYIVDRYGDWVLLDPPFKLKTLALWFGPLAVFLIGGLGLVIFLRHQGRRAASMKNAAPPLTEEERRQVQRIIEEGDGQ